jgi:HEAT repeat protein
MKRTLTILAVLGVACALQAADMSQLVADAAKYESGQSVEPLRKFEQLLRDSAGKPEMRAELEAAMIKLLAPGATFEARRFACQQLAVIGTDAALPALAGLLKGEETAGIACLALGVHPSDKANSMLRDALASAHGRARLQIIATLGSRRDTEAVKPLTELARDNDPLVAVAAIVALGKIADEPACAAVAALRKEAKPAVARIVADASLRIAAKLAADGNSRGAMAICEELSQPAQPVNVRRGAFAALLRFDKDGGEERILATLHGSDALLKPVAIAAIGSLKSRTAAKKFAAELPKLQPCEQAFMIEALAGQSDEAVISAIRAQVASADASVRRAAIVVVGRQEGASAVPLLVKAMKGDKSPEELQDIEVALVGLHGGAAADKAIVAELESAPADAKPRLFTVVARRGAHGAVPALLEESSSGDPAIAQAAFQAVGKLATADDFPAMLERLVGVRAADARSDAESAVSRTMQRIKDPAQRTEIIMARMAKCSDVDGRCSLLGLLPGTGDAKTLDTLKKAGEDPEPAIREAAVRALAAWPDATVWEPLMTVCRKSDSTTLRALALRGLTRLAGGMNAKPDTALIERYRQLMGVSRNADDIKVVLGALAGVAHPDALKVAYPLLSNPGVRAEAELAVRKIANAIKVQNPDAYKEAMQRLQPPKPQPPAKKPAAKK